MYTLDLYSHGNPDLGQYAPVSDRKSVQADSLEALKELVRDYIRRWNLGSGNWPLPTVHEDGEPVGRLAYNMRLTTGLQTRTGLERCD
jgi:hypothetical protein